MLYKDTTAFSYDDGKRTNERINRTDGQEKSSIRIILGNADKTQHRENNRLFLFWFGLICIYCRCGHCKRMAKDWERLAGQWEDSKIGLVAEVDCTDKGDGDDDEKAAVVVGKGYVIILVLNHFRQ